MTDRQIERLAAEQEAYVIQCRRTVHRFAEVSGREVKTSAMIQREMEALGLPFERVSKTGLLAVLETGRPGPHIALRADIDALPVREEPENLKGPRVCISENPETSHACGHDAHTAMLLGTMRALARHQDEWSGTVYFCFEEGEENGGGVDGMLAALERRPVDAVWAIHVYAGLESGKICVSPGPRMAGAAAVDMVVKGKGGHSSRPDLAVNPVFCAAAILMNLSAVWVNKIPAGETVTLGIGSIQGGTVGNAIPDTAHIMGSLRFFNMEEGEKALKLVKSTAEHTAAIHSCSVEFMPRCRVLVGPVINDKGLACKISRGLRGLLPEGAVSDCEPWYASESFSRYCKKWPSVMAHLGIKNPACGSGAAHHNGFFDVDEAVMQTGLKAALKFVDMLQEEGEKE